MAEFDTQVEDGALRVWQRPQPRATYVIGADVAEGLEHGDYSCAQVLDAQSGAQVAMWHGHIEADVFADELDQLGRWYGAALIGVEQNNHGLTTITRLRQLEYPNLYRHRTVDQVSKKVTLKFGWPTNKSTKPLMVDQLNAALRDFEIQVHDKRTVAELKTYIRDEMGKLHGSPHDDTVMALAIANQMIPFALTHHELQAPGPARWTGEWWRLQAHLADVAAEKAKVPPLGYFNRRTTR